MGANGIHARAHYLLQAVASPMHAFKMIVHRKTPWGRSIPRIHNQNH